MSNAAPRSPRDNSGILIPDLHIIHLPLGTEILYIFYNVREGMESILCTFIRRCNARTYVQNGIMRTRPTRVDYCFLTEVSEQVAWTAQIDFSGHIMANPFRKPFAWFLRCKRHELLITIADRRGVCPESW